MYTGAAVVGVATADHVLVPARIPSTVTGCPATPVAPLFNALNVFYVCSATPLQKGLAEVLMANPDYYPSLRERFAAKRVRAVGVLESLGFQIYDSGSAFYIWARIPEGVGDAMQLNERLIASAGVAAVPGSAFADSDSWDDRMRICIAREDDVLETALGKLQLALAR